MTKRSIVTRWQSRQLDAQVFGVMRHTERADTIGAFVDERLWWHCDDFQRWPLDCPLSDLGKERAVMIGQKV